MEIKKKIFIISVMLSILIVFPHVFVSAASSFTGLAAETALLVEADSGVVLYEHNTSRHYPADALARVMTLLLAAEAYKEGNVTLYDVVEMTETAWEDIPEWSYVLGIRPEEEMTVLDLLHCAFMTGASEANNLIAEYVSGNIDAFIRLMNAKAVSIGAENTTFTNTYGKYDSRQFTTASDIFLIYKEALTYPLFVEISGTYRYTTETTNSSEPRTLLASNSMLNNGGRYYLSNCTSGIASSILEGGYSFMGFAESEGFSLISVVLGSDVIIYDNESTLLQNISEARRLFEWGFENFSVRTILSTTDLVAKVPITHGAGADFVNLRPESSISHVLNNDIPIEEFIRDVTIYSEDAGEELFAPISAGTVLGEVSVSRDGVDYGTIILVANTSIELNRMEYIKMQIAQVLSGTTARAVMAILFIIILGYAALVIRYNILRRKKIQAGAERKRQIAEERRQSEQIADMAEFTDFDTITRHPPRRR